MFDNYHPKNQVEAKVCRRDLAKEIEELQEKIRESQNIKNSFENLLQSDIYYRIDSYDDRKTLYAIFGSLALSIPNMDRQLVALIKELEEEQDIE